MNAHKFVAERGIERARDVVELAPENSNYRYYSVDIGNSNSGWHVDYRTNCIDLAELKQVVESVEIVDQLGELNSVKKKLYSKHIGYTHFNVGANGRWAFLDHYVDFIPDSAYHIGLINKHIADYELVESYKSNNGQAINHSCVSDFKENETLDHLSIKQDSQVEVLDMIDVSPNCEVINETH